MRKRCCFGLFFLVTIAVQPALAAADRFGIPKSSVFPETVLVDKTHPIQPLQAQPDILIPPDVQLAQPVDQSEMTLQPVAAYALHALFNAAAAAQLPLLFSSGFRSYQDQAMLYHQRITDTTPVNESVARPGYSEHQTGLAADVITSNYFCAAEGCFALSRAADWLSHNSYRYGFIIRYPDYKEYSTGYEYEPWHLRYIGVPLATKLHHSQQTLEEYYGLP